MAKTATPDQRQRDRVEQNHSMRVKAHQRLDELIDEAQQGDFYGLVGLDLQLEAGTIRLLRRRIDGTDR